MSEKVGLENRNRTKPWAFALARAGANKTPFNSTKIEATSCA